MSTPFNFTVTGSSNNEFSVVVDSANATVNTAASPVTTTTETTTVPASLTEPTYESETTTVTPTNYMVPTVAKETTSYFTKIPITFNNLEKLRKVKSIKLFDSDYQIIPTSGANTQFVTLGIDDIYYTTSNTIISENKRTGAINWTLDWKQILDQDKRLGGEVYAMQNRHQKPTVTHKNDVWPNPIEIRYPPGINADKTRLYITNTDFVHRYAQLYFVEIDALRGEVIKTYVIPVDEMKAQLLGNSARTTIQDATIAFRTSVAVTSDASYEYFMVGGTSGLEYVAELFGVADNESANYLEVNNNGAQGAVVCLKRLKAELNQPDNAFEFNWTVHSGPEKYVGFTDPKRTKFPSQTFSNEYTSENPLFLPISRTDASASPLTYDAFIPNLSEEGVQAANGKSYDPNINLFVPICNGYTLYMNDVSNAKHSDVPQYLVKENSLVILNNLGVSNELSCNFFINNMDVFTKFTHEIGTLATNNVSGGWVKDVTSTRSNGYNAYINNTLDADGLMNNRYVPDSTWAGVFTPNGTGRFSMQIDNLLFVKYIAPNDPSYNIVSGKYDIYSVSGGITDVNRIETLLYPNCSIIDIKRTWVDCKLDPSYLELDVDPSVNVTFSESIGTVTNINDISFIDVSSNSKFSISSKMLLSQNIQKHLDLSLVEIGYKLDSSEASRLNYTGAGLWVSKFTFDHSGNVIVTWGNGNTLPIHESLNFGGTTVRTPSGDWFSHYLLTPIDASNIDAMYNDIMTTDPTHKVYPKMLSVYGYLQKQYDKTGSNQTLAKIYNLHKYMKEVSEERAKNMYKYISSRGMRAMTNAICAIDPSNGDIKWRCQTPDWNDANWNFNIWVNKQNGNFTTFQSPGWTDASAHEYKFTYVTNATKRKYIEYYPPGMDNDTSMPVAVLDNYYVVANKGGHIFKLKRDSSINDVTNYHDLSFDVIEDEFIYGTRELGCNFVGDTNYGYYADNDYYIGNSRNFSELGTHLMEFSDLSLNYEPTTLDSVNLLKNYPMGHSSIVVVDLSTNDISFVKTRNNVRPSPLHTGLVGYRASNTKDDLPVVMVGDPSGTLHVLDIKTMTVKQVETGLPMVRANIVLNDNIKPTRINIIGDDPKGLSFAAGIGIDASAVNEIGKFEVDPFEIIVRDIEYVLPGDTEVPQYATELWASGATSTAQDN